MEMNILFNNSHQLPAINRWPFNVTHWISNKHHDKLDPARLSKLTVKFERSLPIDYKDPSERKSPCPRSKTIRRRFGCDHAVQHLNHITLLGWSIRLILPHSYEKGPGTTRSVKFFLRNRAQTRLKQDTIKDTQTRVREQLLSVKRSENWRKDVYYFVEK